MPLWVYDETGKLVTSQGAFEFTLTADSGTDQTVNNGETVDIAGGVGINSVVGATNTFTLDSVWDYEQVLSSSGAFDVDLTTISKWSSAVKSIEMSLSLRGTVSATQDIVYIFFNSDTTLTNYYRQVGGGQDGATIAGESNNPTLLTISAGTSPTSAIYNARFTIENVNSSSFFKTINGIGGGRYDTTAQRAEITSLEWRNANAINRIAVRTDNNPTDLFVAGSFLRLRFIK